MKCSTSAASSETEATQDCRDIWRRFRLPLVSNGNAGFVFVMDTQCLLRGRNINLPNSFCLEGLEVTAEGTEPTHCLPRII
jgi:hypothetical protein